MIMSNNEATVFHENFDVLSEAGDWRKTWNTPTGISGVHERHISLSYGRWLGINSRIKSRKEYKDCKNLFKNFEEFVRWSRDSYGYDFIDEGTGRMWCVDKDILSFGRTPAYSPETCIFVPNEVNQFTNTMRARRGEYPLGVTYHKRDKCFTSQVSVLGEKLQKSGFKTAEEAHRFWQEGKLTASVRILEKYKQHHKLVDGMLMIAENIKRDIDACVFTNFNREVV